MSSTAGPKSTSRDPQQRDPSRVASLQRERGPDSYARGFRDLLRSSHKNNRYGHAGFDIKAFRHDVAAPLGAIRGLSELLQSHHNHQLDKEGQKALGLLIDAARHLGEIVDGIEEAPRKGETPVCSPSIVLRQSLNSMPPEERERFQIYAAGLDQAGVAVQASDLRRIFHNLLRNAVTHGGPKMSQIVVLGRRGPGPRWVCSVTDNGHGLQLPPSSALRRGVTTAHLESGASGNGLGLTIVQRLATRYGGGVHIESPSSGGCLVQFDLPLVA